MIDTIQIRPLTIDDYDILKDMHTGIEDDYVVRIFERLVTSEEHKIFGLFDDGQLVSVSGYTIFADHYAMLGRWRSDLRYQGKGYATKIVQYIMDELKQNEQIKWIGANTQRTNFPALRVLEKLKLPMLKALHASTLIDSNNLNYASGEKWEAVTSLEEKRSIVQQIENDPDVIFPYQCYYPFPASPTLFKDEEIKDWYFFRNPENNRFVIMNFDQKKYSYMHVIYLWDDVFEQPGLWETILETYKEFQQNYGDDTKIWIDLTDESRQKTNEDAFEFQDAWILHGKWK
ncbi:GNAT family N-acetyltransferase [Filobacillus milosensis]|uniref:GNAT family N-acetyltransferase n=1 Tax=Filobacillus milosensis TaxID=94137 RepID=A0A4Y8ITD8_9BACI|nr:GNAT family N-acetyltransferase [Filobacillus milosensis]TFB24309.1 GNAT family N-acetyltransferase [Filobacillus milosensis]